MNVLDHLDALEREATPPLWRPGKIVSGDDALLWLDEDGFLYPADRELIALSRNHLRALIEVTRAAESMYGLPIDPSQDDWRALGDALAPLVEEGEA